MTILNECWQVDFSKVKINWTTQWCVRPSGRPRAMLFPWRHWDQCFSGCVRDFGFSSCASTRHSWGVPLLFGAAISRGKCLRLEKDLESPSILVLKHESRILRQDECPRILLYCYRARSPIARSCCDIAEGKNVTLCDIAATSSNWTRNSGPNITSPKVTLLLELRIYFIPMRHNILRL